MEQREDLNRHALVMAHAGFAHSSRHWGFSVPRRRGRDWSYHSAPGTIHSQERQHDIEEAGRGHGIRKYNVGWEYSAVALVLAGQTWLSPPPVGFRGSKAFRDWKTVQVE